MRHSLFEFFLRRPFWMVAACLVLTGLAVISISSGSLTRPALGQDDAGGAAETEDSSDEPAVDEKPAVDDKIENAKMKPPTAGGETASSEAASTPEMIINNWPADVRIGRVQLTEAEPAPSMFERVNGVFETAVGYMASVLFWSPIVEEREYIQLDKELNYIRPLESKDPFQQIGPEGPIADVVLTEAEVKRLQLRGQLTPGREGPIRPGLYRGEEVEFVTIPVGKPTKYRRVGDLFHRETGMQEQVSKKPEDTLSMAEVEQLANQGMLKLNTDRLEKDILAKLKDKPQVAAELADAVNAEPELLRPVLDTLLKRKLISSNKGGEFRVAKPDSVDESKEPLRSYLLTEKIKRAPLVVLWLAAGSVIFTLAMGFFNIRGFTHAVNIVRGKYDNPEEPGEVTHFQALSSALSATVGLGNIAGVTVAMTIGGPGAFFWMFVCGFFGMTSKFVESTLGQKYRRVNEDGTVRGGPMEYLHRGLAEMGLGPIGLVLSFVFAVMCILASFGGGNMFQANQSSEQVLGLVQTQSSQQLDILKKEISTAAENGDDAALAKLEVQKKDLEGSRVFFGQIFRVVFGLVLAAFVGMVIVGGIKRIGAAASKVVPTMCLLYISACLYVIAVNITAIPEMVGSVFTEAFSPTAFGGGLIGVLIIGVQRAAFSNEAGVGSAAIAHSAAKTDQPVREGCVAMLGPFIDTIVVCSMTAMVILVTGAWSNEEWVVEKGLAGAPLASQAFESQIWFFPYILTIAIVLFAYSTLVSWSYYGEKCWERLFGARSTIVYKFLYLAACFLGAIVNLGAVLDFSDMMILAMAFPNVFGLLLLSPKVRRDLGEYWKSYRAGKFKTFH